MIRFLRGRRIAKAYKAHVNTLMDQGIVAVKAANKALVSNIANERHAQWVAGEGLNTFIRSANAERDLLLHELNTPRTKDTYAFDHASERIITMINNQLSGIEEAKHKHIERGALK